MTIRRRATVAGAAALSLAALAACGTKPTPIATVGSGTDTVHTEAACYNDGKMLATSTLKDCATKDTKTVTVVDGDKIRFGVDKSIADEGWFIMVGQQQTAISKRTYRTLDSQSLFSNPQTGASVPEVSIRIVRSKTGKDISGMWNFKLVRKDS